MTRHWKRLEFAVMLRALCQAHLSRVSTLASVCRSVTGTRSGRPTSPHIVLIVARKAVETEKKSFFSVSFAFPWSRQAGRGCQSRLSAMTGGNTSTDSEQERSTKGYHLMDDRYKDYRGLAILKFIGFEITELSATKSTGRFVVSKNSCQPFNVLHGGTTAYIAESIASVSAAIAADFQRIAGIELTCSHLRSVPIESEVEVTAVPLRVGKRVQVWEVKFETLKPEKPEKSELGESREISESSSASSRMVLSAISRVTLLVGLPITLESKL